MAKLTKKLVETLEVRDKDYVVWDSQTPGFGVRIRPTGRRVYILKYRNKHSRQRKPAIGIHGAITTDQARSIAKQWLAAVERGLDPSADKKAARDVSSVKDLAERYLTEHAEVHKRLSSVINDRRLIESRIVPALGSLPVSGVGRPDVDKLHRSLKATPYEANRTLAVMSKMFNLAELWGLRPDGSNPCRHIKRLPEEKRTRFLSTEELERLGEVLIEAEATGSEAPSIVAAIRLLIFTGCRLSEIWTLRWEDVDFDRQCLRLPTTKTGPKLVHLGPPALEVLTEIERVEGNPHVIVGEKPEAHLVNLQKPWRRIRKLAGLDDLRLHDLRHTFASVGAGAGLSLPMIGKMLGHTQAQTTQRYAHLAADPVKEATEKVSNQIAAAMKGEAGEVVSLPGRGAKR